MTSTRPDQPPRVDVADSLPERRPTPDRSTESEEQVRQAQKLEALGRLAGSIAHDFNNMLVVINGYSDLVAARVADDAIHADVREIRRAGERAATLTRQLLSFCRHEMPQPRVLSVNDVVRGVETMLRALIGEAVVLEMAMASALGSVLADRGQLEQIVVNLAVNARCAMPDGGTLLIETANVTFGAGDVGRPPRVELGRDYVRLRVRDDGIGMDVQTRERIFEPFFTTKPLGEGTGLGLAIVLGIAEQSGGHLDVTSAPGVGSTFDLYLPAARAELEPINELDGAAGRLSAGWETVLVVEDDTDVRAATRRFLEDAGHQVLEAANGGEALDVIERFAGDVHLVITDVVMPGMSGHDLVRRLSTIRPRLRTLYISGYANSHLLPRQLVARDAAHLQKPFTAETLTRKVRDTLDGR
jgi:two-component system cell cycle sensor histidine kinase/response regulator CckA